MYVPGIFSARVDTVALCIVCLLDKIRCLVVGKASHSWIQSLLLTTAVVLTLL